MGCRCTENRMAMAQYVGRDASQELPESIRRSIATCPDCREYYESLTEAMNVLEQTQEVSQVTLKRSMWDEISNRLPETTPRKKSNWNWREQVIPVFSMTAACLALAMVFIETGNHGPNNRVYQTTSAKGSLMSVPLTPVQNNLEPEWLSQPSAGPQFQLDDSANGQLFRGGERLFFSDELSTDDELMEQFLNDVRRMHRTMMIPVR